MHSSAFRGLTFYLFIHTGLNKESERVYRKDLLSQLQPDAVGVRR